MPGLPPLRFTRFHARFRFGRLNASSISKPVPGHAVSEVANDACPLRSALGASPLPSSGSSSCLDFWTMVSSRPPGQCPCDRSALQRLAGCLLWPRLTSRSVDVTTWPFQAQSEISPDKNTVLHRTTAGFTPGPIGHGSFAVRSPLASEHQRLISDSCSSAHGFVPRFLQTVGRPPALALPFPRCDLLRRGLSPPRQCP